MINQPVVSKADNSAARLVVAFVVMIVVMCVGVFIGMQVDTKLDSTNQSLINGYVDELAMKDDWIAQATDVIENALWKIELQGAQIAQQKNMIMGLEDLVAIYTDGETE